MPCSFSFSSSHDSFQNTYVLFTVFSSALFAKIFLISFFRSCRITAYRRSGLRSLSRRGVASFYSFFFSFLRRISWIQHRILLLQFFLWFSRVNPLVITSGPIPTFHQRVSHQFPTTANGQYCIFAFLFRS